MPNKYDADFAICLSPSEASNLDELDKDFYYWNGWRNRHWPAFVILPGKRLYGFDPRPKKRNLCVLLEITKGGAFEYRNKAEFKSKVKKITGLEPDIGHPQWTHIPEATSDKRKCTGVALRWRVIKEVSIKLPGKFSRLGWRWLGDKEKLKAIGSDFSDLYSEGNRKLTKHTVIERNYKLRNDAKAYWRLKMRPRIHCLICKFDFGKKYKEYGKDFIEMHHLAPLSAPGGAKKCKVQDLVPVCSNCHRILHWRRLDPLPIKELQKFI